MRYYKWHNEHTGTRYFRVKDKSAMVLQVVTEYQKKKGRPHCIGITEITYMTFISSWGYGLETRNKNITKITKEEFDTITIDTFMKIVDGIKKEEVSPYLQTR